VNPFEKYLSPETLLQRDVVQYIRAQYPRWKVIHPPNEGRRTPFEQYLIKTLGVESGVADLIICAPVARVLFLELKAGKNKPTPTQAGFLADMGALGFSATWAASFDAARAVVDAWAAA
jgi:hypothetical protein